MTHAAMTEGRSATDPVVVMWSELFQKCSKAAKKRGKIAHKMGFCFSTPDLPLYVLVDPIWHKSHPNDWKEAKQMGITATTLDGMWKDWLELAKMLTIFGLALWNREPLPTSLAQLAGLPHPPQNLAVLNPKAPA
jgi:hypothetical protein